MTKKRSIGAMIEEQVKRWQISKTEKSEESKKNPVITISREPGSGGRIIASGVSEKLGFDLFHQEILNEMAESTNISQDILKTLDETGLSVLEEWINSLVDDRHLWPDRYLRHLMKVVGAIARHGNAVIVGRGGNFILPRENVFRVRVIAPLKTRIKNVSETFKVSKDEAERHIIRSESERRAFIRKYFNSDIADPLNYDLIINTAGISISNAVEAVAGLTEKYCVV